FRVCRMIELLFIGHQSVDEFRKHQIRTKRSELDRKEIIDSLLPGDALIIWDFSLKVLPNKFVETQSAWYGKSGISYHLSYVIANINGDLKHHSFGHAADDFKQDSVAVSAIAEHVLRILKEKGINRVFLRSDNAGNYRNAALMCTLYELSIEIGIEVMAYIFSEAQSGKGDADREISHSKRKIREYVRSGGNTTSASEIIDALCAPTLLKASSFFEINVQVISISKAVFPGISSVGSFRFEAGGIRARRHDAYGKGSFFDEKKMERNVYSYGIGNYGGTIKSSDEFWGDFGGNERSKSKSDETEAALTPSVEEDEGKLIYQCSDRLCTSRFMT
ncbi:hypothetical protein PFISCL1PPCAC_13774, partial [Pristionchus fissidentatus]